MARHVDHVIGARHDVKITVLVHIARIARLVIAGEMRQIGLAEPILGIPQRGQRAGGQGQPDGDGAKRAGGDRVPRLVKNLHVIARHGHRGAALLHRQQFDAKRVCGDRPAGFGLPPMVDHRHAQLTLGPGDRVGIGPLARQEQRPQTGKVVAADMLALGVVAAHGADGGRRGEETFHPVFRYHAPEGAGVRGADGLALEDDGRRADQQGAIADVAVPHDPADIRGRPEHVARAYVVNMAHRPGQGDHMAAGMAHHALGLAGCPRSIEDVGWVIALDRFAIGGGDAGLEAVPVQIPAGDQGCDLLFALEDHAEIGFVGCLVDGAVQKRLVMDDAPRFEPARGGDDRARFRVVDPHRQFMRGEPAEDDRMHRADPGAGQHRLQRLGDHRHVEDDAVALGHAARLQRPGETCHARLQFGIGQLADRAGDRAVVDNGHAIPVTRCNVPVHRVPAGIRRCLREPFARRTLIEIGLFRRLGPVDRAGGLQPESLGVRLPGIVDFAVCHCMPSLHPRLFVTQQGAYGATLLAARSLQGGRFHPQRLQMW